MTVELLELARWIHVVVNCVRSKTCSYAQTATTAHWLVSQCLRRESRGVSEETATEAEPDDLRSVGSGFEDDSDATGPPSLVSAYSEWSVADSGFSE